MSGSAGAGLEAGRGTVITGKGGGFSLAIQGSGQQGIDIAQQSIGRFDPGVNVSGSGMEGIRLGENSSCFGIGMITCGNTGPDMRVDNGSTLQMDDSQVGNLDLSLGAQASVFGGTIASVTCDETVLTRGDIYCPIG